MKHDSLFRYRRDTAPTRQLNLPEINRQLESLNGQHAEIIEKFRLLHGDIDIQAAAQLKWHDFENQVVKLRFEIESFKQTF